MRVISTTDISRPGNDCYIYETITLVEQFGIYVIIGIKKITGWAEREEVLVLYDTTVEKKAFKAYQDYGGVLDDGIPTY